MRANLGVLAESLLVPSQESDVDVLMLPSGSPEEEVDRSATGDPPAAREGLHELTHLVWRERRVLVGCHLPRLQA